MSHSTKTTFSANQSSAAIAIPVAGPVSAIPQPRPSLSGTSTSWKSTSGGNFNTAANWSNGVPVAGIDATIDEASTDSITVTLSAVNDTADALTTQFAGLSLANATLTLQGALAGNDGSSISTGTGTALSQAGGLVDFQNGPSQNDLSTISSGGAAVIQTSGTIEVDAGTLAINGNSSFAGTLTGKGGMPTSGIVELAGGATYSFASGAVLSVGQLDLLGGGTNMILGGSLTYKGEFVQSANSTLNIGAHVFTLDDTAGTLSALAGLVTGTQLTNQATLAIDAATLSSGTTLSNSSTLLFNQGNVFSLGNGGTAATLLSNTAGGTIALQNGNTIIQGGSLTNAALLQLGISADLSTSAVLTNTGTISVGTGDTMSISGSLSDYGVITGAGLFEITPSGTMDEVQAGATISVGELELNGGNSSLSITFDNPKLTAGTVFVYQAVTVDMISPLTYAGNFVDEGYAGDATFNLGTSAMRLSGTNTFDATNFGADIFTGAGSLVLGGTTTITGDGLAIGEGTALQNTGHLNQAAAVQLGDTNAVGSGSNTGVWDVIGNAELGGNVYQGASNPYSLFTNSGIFEMTASGDVATIDAVFDNTGTLATSVGAITDVIDSFTNSGTLSGAGELEISGGTSTFASSTVLSVGTLALAGSGALTLGESLTYAGAFSDGSSSAAGLTLGGDTLTLSGATTFGASGTTTTINGPGTLALTSSHTTFAGNSTVVLGQTAALVNSGNVTQDGTLQIGDAAGNSASATNAATGTWTVALGNGIQRGANFGTQFTNAGLFQDTELGSATAVYAVFDNAANLKVSGTELDFYSNFTNTGTISGTGAIGLRGSAVGTFSTGNLLNVAQFNLYDTATMDLSIGVAYAGIFNDQGYGQTTINLDAHNLQLSKTATFGGSTNVAYVDGPGTLSLIGTTTITSNGYGLEVGGAIIVRNAKLVTQDGQFQLGDNSGLSATATNTATGTWAIATGNGISTGSNTSSSFNNAGLFENTGSGDTQTITPVFVNTGTIAIAAEDATDFTNAFSNTGTIRGAGAFVLTNNAVGTFSAGEVISVAQIDLNQYATLDLATNLAYAGIFDDQGYGSTTVNLAAHSLSLTGTAALGASTNLAVIDGPGTLSVSGATTITATGYGLELGSTAAMLNTGNVLQNGQLQIGDSTGALASVTNAAGGVWAMATGNGIGTGSNASSSFTNKGLLENTGTNDTQTISAVVSNIGTLSIGTGDTTDLINSFTNTGTISGNGALALRQSAVATFAAGSAVAIAQIDLFDSSTLDLTTSLTYAGQFSDQGYGQTTLNLAANTLSLTGQASFGGSTNLAYVTGSGTLSLAGTTTITQTGYGLELGGTTALVNAGTVTQAGGLQIGDSSGNIATVTNEAAGIWQLGTSNSIGTGSDASSSFTNAGQVINIGTSNTERISAVFNNTGTLTDTSAGSTIALAGGGSIAGTLSGAGEIDFDNGGLYTLGAGAVLSIASIGIENTGTEVILAGAASYAGTLTEGAGASLDLSTKAAKLTLTGQDSLDGSITGSGTVLLSTGGTLIADNLTIGGSAVLQDSGGTIAQAQNMAIGNNAASTASLSIAAGSTYEITGNLTIAAQGSGAIANAGTLKMLGQATGTTTIDPLVTNTGTVASTSGTLVFGADVTNNKLVTAAYGHEVAFDYSLVSSGTATGTISLTAGGMALFGGYVGSAETLTFTDGSSSAATLDDATGFAGTISGFTGSNALTLADFENAKASYSGGILTLAGQTDNGTATTVELHFAGSYTLASFTVANNGTGGTLITDPKT